MPEYKFNIGDNVKLKIDYQDHVVKGRYHNNVMVIQFMGDVDVNEDGFKEETILVGCHWTTNGGFMIHNRIYRESDLELA